MKNITNKLITAACIASLGLTATSAIAGPDFVQQQIIQRFTQAKQQQALVDRQQVQATEAGKQDVTTINAEQCQKLMEQGKDANGS